MVVEGPEVEIQIRKTKRTASDKGRLPIRASGGKWEDLPLVPNFNQDQFQGLTKERAAARRHLVLMSACQWHNQRRHLDMMLDARARKANLAELRVTSAEYSVAAISLLMSWCRRESSSDALACICQSQISNVLAKKDAAVADFMAHAAAW